MGVISSVKLIEITFSRQWRELHLNDQQKSKEELVKELKALREQTAKLEAEIAALRKQGGGKQVMQERAPRVPLDADIEFMGDFDIVQAKGVNISEGGICFSVKEDLPFEIRFERNGCLETRRANFVWAKRLETGGYHLGFKFVAPKEDYPTF